MIFERLEQKITAMKDLQKRETLKENRKEQEAADQRYSLLVLQTHQLIDAVVYTKQYLTFSLDDDSITELSSLCDSLKHIVHSGNANMVDVRSEEANLKKVYASVKKEWAEFFNTLTGTVVSTLNVIKGINALKANACLTKINSAENWTNDLNIYAELKKGISDAKLLIQSLGLDQEIIEFLQKMNGGKATVMDLSEKVLSWIHNENIAGRIYLSFSKSVVLHL